MRRVRAAPNSGSAGLRLRTKGQMEIMGLAIIVILIALGLLFAVQWMLKAPTTKQVQRAKESVLAANFMNTMLGTTTECNQRTVRDLLQDCALTQGATMCGEQSSCDYAHSVIQELFDTTFKTWKVPYHFAIKGASPVESMDFGTKPCSGELEKKVHPVLVRPGFELTLTLEICR